jgi:hypothetical protein
MTIPIQNLRELLAKATPGPWTFYSDSGAVCINDGCGIAGVPIVLMYADRGHRVDDAALIVAMRNELPSILDRLEKLEKVAVAARVVSSQRNGPYLMEDMEATLHAEAVLKQAIYDMDAP